MSLKELVTSPSYLHRRRVFIDSYLATSNTDGSDTWNQSRFWQQLENQAQNVVSAELTGYCISQDIAAPFPFPTDDGRFAGSRFLDIYMEVSTNPAVNLTFSVEMPYRRTPDSDFSVVSSNVSTMEKLRDMIQFQMNALGVAPFLNATTTWSYHTYGYFSDDTYGAFHFSAETDIGAGFVPTLITFQFASGPNAGNTPYKQLGFNNPVDVGGVATALPDGTTAYWPIPDTFVDFYPNRYVDIFVREITDFTPHSRIFLTGVEDYATSKRIPTDRPRILTRPPRRLESLSITLVLSGGRPLYSIHNYGTDLIFDLLTAVPQLDVPEWVKQVFVY